jgi:protocatechuate 3,4-dioxygenase, alpha subunit
VISVPLTSSQTVGPFFHDGLLRADAQRNVLVAPETAGERIRIVGQIYDGDGHGLPDAMIEIWQANHYGRYNHFTDTRDLPLDPAFSGFGRTGTGADGVYCFETIKPGAVPFDDTRQQAPHICVAVFGRGLLNHLYTRLYFADDPANADDPILQRIPRERQATLLARRSSGDGVVVYHFDVVLQGTGETVFFNFYSDFHND